MTTCTSHLDPKTWHEMPAPKRFGDSRKWRTTVCLKCGKWLGYRLAAADPAKEEAHAERLGRYDRSKGDKTA